jgi:hypothetical protein
MQVSRSRARIARLTVGLVALTIPLAGASVAQAAIGTANPVTTDGPDIRSATITAPLVTVCFDQAVDLNGPSAPGDIVLTPYKNAGGAPGDSITPGGTPGGTPPLVQGGTAPVSLGNNCIRSTFPGDLTEYTVATVLAGTVRNEADVTPNLTDSAPLLGSDTTNGTRGNSTGPDLESVIVLGPENQIAYTFDQDVRCNAAGTAPVNATPLLYAFFDQNGTQFGGDAFVACDGNQVLVAFTSPGDNVTTAQEALVGNGLVAEADTILRDPARLLSVAARPNPFTNDPRLISSELVDPQGGSSQMDFVFSDDVTQAGLDLGEFAAMLSDTTQLIGTSAQVINGDTVRVTFGGAAAGGAGPALEEVSEFVVWGNVGTGAARAQDDNVPSLPGGKPAGGNAGAFALGYTTGPDALSASTNQAGGQVTIVVDQRPCNPVLPARLVNDDGVLFGNPSTATNLFGGCSSTPGQKPVTFQFAQSELANAVGVYLPGFPFGAHTTGVFRSTRGYPNMDQIVSIR